MPELEIGFELARPCDEHARLVMTWRNDPDTLAMFFHHEPKVWDAFREEFRAEYFRFPDLPPLFALHEGKRIAFLRFLPHGEGGEARRACSLSINVDPAQRGRGLGTAALRAAREIILARGFDDIYALIRIENQGSQKTFTAAGFDLLEETDRLISDTGERCRIRVYRAELICRFVADDRVFIIAEAGSNWRMGSAPRDAAMAKALIEVAAESGADAVKFQTYRPETVYVEGAGGSDYLVQAGIRRDISEIFAELSMPYEMVPELAADCREKGIVFMTTPFSTADFDAVDPHVSLHKIASYEISHLRLLEKAARSGKPLILSTGASVEEDIAWALGVFRGSGGGPLCLMQCTAKYPAPPGSMNLRVIPWLKRRFGVCVGLSDHSRDPVLAPVAAVALGARVIEKHFTLDRRLPGPDHSFALTPSELKTLVQAVREAGETLGSGIKEVQEPERELHAFARRGIQTTRDIAQGEVLREGVNLDILRPGKRELGVHPRHLAGIEGKRASRDIPTGEGLREGDWL